MERFVEYLEVAMMLPWVLAVLMLWVAAAIALIQMFRTKESEGK
jgi:hypothetical protein